jgi:deoxyadenosine/deoxycytidine kinase
MNNRGSLISRNEGSRIKVAVVGACASGKSTLVAALQEAGYEARHVAQEHSYVPAMWQRISQPDFLIYLDVNYGTLMTRRPWLNFRPEHLAEQNKRLEHAREHCHLYIDTNQLGADEVRNRVLSFLKEYGTTHNPGGSNS